MWERGKEARVAKGDMKTQRKRLPDTWTKAFRGINMFYSKRPNSTDSNQYRQPYISRYSAPSYRAPSQSLHVYLRLSETPTSRLPKLASARRPLSRCSFSSSSSDEMSRVLPVMPIEKQAMWKIGTNVSPSSTNSQPETCLALRTVSLSSVSWCTGYSAAWGRLQRVKEKPHL